MSFSVNKIDQENIFTEQIFASRQDMLFSTSVGESMKIIRDIKELKKGDTVIVKDACFEARGYSRVSGEVFNIEQDKPNFTFKCKETESIESISLENGVIFLID